MKKGKHNRRKRIAIVLAKITAALFLASVLWVLILKWAPVKVTPLMIKRMIEYKDDKSFKTKQTWKDIEDISPNLAKAVVAGEDQFFLLHWGFDIKGIKLAIKRNKQNPEKLHGGSTISQQTAKNVFMLGSRTWFRKAFEAYFTVLIELIWGKKRILEVYLNVVEMGPGIYGAEAAAQHYFHRGASKLTMHQSCLIAACLPSPLKRNPLKPSEYVSKHAAKIQNWMWDTIHPEWYKAGAYKNSFFKQY